MKNSLWNSDLWQKKRTQLNVDVNPDADWDAMRSALDEQMPVAGNSGAGAGKFAAIIGSGLVAVVAVYLLLHSFNVTPDRKEKPSANHPTDQKTIATNKLSADQNLDNNTSTYNDSVTNLKAQIASAKGTLKKLNSSANPSKNVRDSIVVLNAKIASINNILTRTTLGHLKKVTEEKKEKIPDLVLIPSKESSGASGRSKASSGRSANGKGRYLNAKNDNGLLVHNREGKGLDDEPNVKTSDGQQTQNNGANDQPTDNQLSVANGFHPQMYSSWFSQNSRLGYFDLKKQNDRSASKDKTKKSKDKSPAKPLPFDYGILVGANTGGSFTGQSQNKNIYGSLPVDGYVGLFADFHIKDKWGMNVQVRALSPVNISGGYGHANQSKVDSGKLIQVSDSRKVYFVSVPIHATYQIADNLKLKAGPVVNVLIKQINGVAALSPSTIQKDSVYYKKTVAQLAGTTYDQTINIGLSAGVNYQYKRLNLELNYMQSVTGYKVTSDFGSYKANPGTLQFTVGFQLNRLKDK